MGMGVDYFLWRFTSLRHGSFFYIICLIRTKLNADAIHKFIDTLPAYISPQTFVFILNVHYFLLILQRNYIFYINNLLFVSSWISHWYVLEVKAILFYTKEYTFNVKVTFSASAQTYMGGLTVHQCV